MTHEASIRQAVYSQEILDMKIFKVTEHEPVLCPALNSMINVVDCYETRFGISNILAPIGIDEDTAMMKVCSKCGAGKKEYVVKKVIELSGAVAEQTTAYNK